MMCAVFECDNNNFWKANLTYFNFPKDPELLQKWIHFCKRSDRIRIHAERVCMDHFNPDDFERNVLTNEKLICLLKPGAVPSLYQPIYVNVNNPSLAVVKKNKQNMHICKDCIELRTELDAIRSTMKKVAERCTELNLRETELETRIKSLEAELKESTLKATHMREKLGNIFTKNQIEKLSVPTSKEKQHWVESDITRSINLYSVSAKAYKLLRKNGFPLPSVQLLQNWAQSIELSPGILKPITQILAESKDMSPAQKVCVLSFDEMKLKRSYCYNKSTDTTSAPVDYVLVAMLRGLMSKWEQPIFYSFECKMDAAILNSILKTFENCGFTIVALVGKLDGSNNGLMDQKLSPKRPWFSSNGIKVFAFPDVSHLLELLINNFFDHGFLINGKKIDRNIVCEMLSCTSSELTASQKIVIDNLNVSGAEHKKATKDFSQSIVKVISKATNLQLIKSTNLDLLKTNHFKLLKRVYWEECYKLFKLTSDWFDIMNVSTPASESGENIPEFCQLSNDQNKTLFRMTSMMLGMRVIGQTNELPFQRGIIHSIAAIRHFYKDMAQRFGFKYVLTNRLHKDTLENTLDLLGTRGGLQTLPNQEEFRSRLTSHILGHNEIIISDVLSEGPENAPILQPPLTSVILKTIAWPMEEDNLDSKREEEELKTLDCDNLLNLAEYICQKLRNTIPANEVDGLAEQLPKMVKHLTYLDNVFKSSNKEDLVIGCGFQKNLFTLAKDVECHPEIKRIFFSRQDVFEDKYT